MAAATESLNDIVSRIVLQHNMVDEDQLDEAMDLQRQIMDTEGKRSSLERILLDMGILRGKQLKELVKEGKLTGKQAMAEWIARKKKLFGTLDDHGKKSAGSKKTTGKKKIVARKKGGHGSKK